MNVPNCSSQKNEIVYRVTYIFLRAKTRRQNRRGRICFELRVQIRCGSFAYCMVHGKFPRNSTKKYKFRLQSLYDSLDQERLPDYHGRWVTSAKEVLTRNDI